LISTEEGPDYICLSSMCPSRSPTCTAHAYHFGFPLAPPTLAPPTLAPPTLAPPGQASTARLMGHSVSPDPKIAAILTICYTIKCTIRYQLLRRLGIVRIASTNLFPHSLTSAVVEQRLSVLRFVWTNISCSEQLESGPSRSM
jgi:hypothetical protein